VGTVATLIMATSYGFLAYADNLHFHAYAMLTSAVAMRCYVRAMDPLSPRRLRWFVLAAVFMAVTAMFTWSTPVDGVVYRRSLPSVHMPGSPLVSDAVGVAASGRADASECAATKDACRQ